MHVAFRIVIVIALILIVLFMSLKMFSLGEYIELARNASNAMRNVIDLAAPYKILHVSWSGDTLYEFHVTNNPVQVAGRGKARYFMGLDTCDEIYTYFNVNLSQVSDDVCVLYVDKKRNVDNLALSYDIIYPMCNGLWLYRTRIYYTEPGTIINPGDEKFSGSWTSSCLSDGRDRIPILKGVKFGNNTVYVGEECAGVRVCKLNLSLSLRCIVGGVINLDQCVLDCYAGWGICDIFVGSHEDFVCGGNDMINDFNLSKITNADCEYIYKSYGAEPPVPDEGCPRLVNFESLDCCPMMEREVTPTGINYKPKVMYGVICGYNEEDDYKEAKWRVCFKDTDGVIVYTQKGGKGTAWKCEYNETNKEGKWKMITKYGEIYNNQRIGSDIFETGTIDLSTWNGGAYNQNLKKIVITKRANFTLMDAYGKKLTVLGPIDFEVPHPWNETTTKIGINTYPSDIRRIFVTSTRFLGSNFIRSVNDACDSVVNDAELKYTFKPVFLDDSDDLSGLTSRYTFFTLDGKKIGNDTELKNNNLQNSINITEKLTAYNGKVWTGNVSDGKCRYGLSNKTDSNWIKSGSTNCSSASYPIYCVEQMR